jgi:hypothetical protein
MNTLIYKRTHTGDPDKSGIFGIHDCMKRVRRREFDAVIGVGGKKPWHGYKNIAGKITWIGIDPIKEVVANLKGPLVRFKYFVLWDENGPDLKTYAPDLFKYMFEDQQVRVVMSRSLPIEMQEEVTNILTLAKKFQSETSFVLEKNISTRNKC